jgi:hypothetical protein
VRGNEKHRQNGNRTETRIERSRELTTVVVPTIHTRLGQLYAGVRANGLPERTEIERRPRRRHLEILGKLAC